MQGGFFVEKTGAVFLYKEQKFPYPMKKTGGMEMITLKEQELLEAIYRGSRKAQMDIQAVLGKVYDDDLALDLNSQSAGYSRIQEKAEDVLLNAGIIPETTGILERTRRWASIQASTALNISTGHIASLIQDTEKESLERVERAMDGITIQTTGAYQLGEEFRELEKQNMRVLNSYRF